MSRTVVIILVLLFIVIATGIVFIRSQSPKPLISGIEVSTQDKPEQEDYVPDEVNPLYIEYLRNREYPTSDFVIEETLESGSNYKRYIASYISDGNKIYGLLTVPNTPRPENGYPTIIFLHGYIPPDQYVTTQDYEASQDGLARSGFVTYKPDLRGHGKSEGIATSAHMSQDYVIDTLNLIPAIKNYQDVDPTNIGLWGHSNGGEIGLRVMVVSNEVKAGVFWAGVVGSYQDMFETYLPRISFLNRMAPEVFAQYDQPSNNPEFWEQIEPFEYLSDVSGPIQLHHGTADSSVPYELSVSLHDALQGADQESELYLYEGSDHNMSGVFGQTMNRSVEFFTTHLQ